jgi:hypothetical protein
VTETSLHITPTDAARIQALKAAQDGQALLRRSYYVYVMSAASFGLILTVMLYGTEPSLAKVIVESSFSLLEIIAVAYLGANVIDRSRLVDRFVRNTSNTTRNLN